MRMSEQTFVSSDGAQLTYRVWLPEKPAEKAILFFHRGHEHSGRWRETVERLGLDDFAIFAWDQRGHGNSPGERGSAPNIATVIKDADCFARHVCQAHGIAMENVAVVAHSVGMRSSRRGGCMIMRAHPARCSAGDAGVWRVKLYVPFALPMLRIKQKLLRAGDGEELCQSDDAHARPGRGAGI